MPPISNDPTDPGFDQSATDQVDTPGVVTADTPAGNSVLDTLVKAATDINQVEVDAVRALIDIAQMRAKANVMPVEVTFAKALFRDRYQQLPFGMIKDIEEYLAKIGDGSVPLSDLDAVAVYGLELHIKNEGLREIATLLAPNLGRDALNILKIFGLL